MKSKILTLLFVLGCCSFAFSQATDGICTPATTVDPVNVTTPSTTACSDGTNAPVFGTPSGSLPDTDYVVEVNGALDVINQTGVPDAVLADGDVVCVTAINYDLATIDGILTNAAGVCQPGGFLDCDGTFGLPGLGQTIADLVAGTNDGVPGLNSLDEALALAASFGTPINSVADAVVALDGVNGAIAGFFPPGICYATSAPVCYTIDDSDPACGGGGAVCDALAGEPLVTPEELCDTDAGAFDLSTKFNPASGGFDDGAGNIDPVNTNYVAVDQATGEILAVATSAATIDLSGAPVGTTACVYQLAYTQALLDDVTTFLDDLLCNTLCVPITGPCLGDVGYCPGVTPVELAPFLDILNQFFGFNEAQICNFLDNQIITITDPTGLIGDQTIDLAANGLDFCADKSDAPYCVEIISCAACDPAIATITADPAVVTSESTCEADGVTLSGGVIDPPATACPAGSTLEYSTDGGTTWSATIPVYDQTTTITVDTRCVCDADATDISMIGSVTTVPGMCMTVDACTALAGEALPDAATEVCNDAAFPVDANTLFDAASGGFDSDGDGVVDAMVNTNYIAVDANGDIVAVTAAGATTLDLSALADGETACIYQLAYTQGTLDAVTTFLDDLLCNTLCVPITGPCLGDVGYCPGVTPVELAPFLDLLNTFFGFNEVQICDFIDNQVITITDPTGLIGDQMIDLVALGIDFCVDKSAVYCVTVSSAACPSTVCEADAPTMSIDCTDCGNGTTGGPCTVTDAGDGSANAGEITEYLVIDDAAGTATTTPNGIISVGTLADAQAAVDGLADGEEVCVTAITHTQTELDVIISEIEAAIAALGLSLGLPAAGNTLADVYGAIQALAGGATVDLATIETLIANGAGGTVDLGAALGLPAGILTVDLSPFCYNVDPAVCVTGATCDNPVCEITAITAGMPMCAADGLTYDVTVTVTGTDASVMLDDGTGPVAATTTTFTFPAGAGYTITVTDSESLCVFGPFMGNDPGCDTGTCMITATVTGTPACDTGGDDDPSNDMVTFTVAVTDNGNGDATGWSDGMGNSGTYGSTATYTLVAGNSMMVTFTDAGDPDCMATVMLDAPVDFCETAENIPTVGEWGLIILGLLMSITAVVGIRQRREEEAYS